MISRLPSYAAWVCGFSKLGYFATYDSSPDTFLINVGNDLFTDKVSDTELRKNIGNLRSNIYHSYKKWNVIKGKNFLCFSPTGVYLALYSAKIKDSTTKKVTFVAFSEDEKRIMTLSSDGVVIVRDLSTIESIRIK